MTKKLYENEPHLNSFDAKILDCHADGKFFLVELSQTAFFPEGGGQLADTGKLNDSNVIDVQEKDGVILHKVDGEFTVGETVHGEINRDDRFDRMQNHSGEHIVSGIIHTMFGLNNVGFHMNETVTLDVDGDLTAENLAEVEREANEAVYKNVPITACYPSDEELAGMDYRSKLEGLEHTRIVTVEGYDRCACCAPHVARTGEIGIIKIVDSMRIKKCTRITIVCGRRALTDYAKKHSVNKEIMGLLSAKTYETAESVKRLLDNYSEAKKTIQTLSGEKAILSLGGMAEIPGGYTYGFTENLSTDDIVYCTKHFKQQGIENLAIFSGNDNSGYRFAVCSADNTAFEQIRELFKTLNGRGGGTNALFQGQIKSDRKTIESALSDFKL